MSVTK